MNAGHATATSDAMARLMQPDCRQDPYPFLAWLRDNEPVHKTPVGTYLISRHADVARVFQDSGSVFLSPDQAKLEVKFPQALQHRSIAVFASSIAVSNPPGHTKLRKAISRDFTARRVIDLRPQIEALCDRLLDQIEEQLRDGAEVDIQRELSEPLAIGALSELLGLPEDDRTWLATLVEGVLAAFPGAPIEVIQRADDLTAEMEEYLTGLIDRRRATPTGDLVSALAGPDTWLAEDELVPMLWALWCAGFKTTSGGISHGVLATLEHPDLHQSIRDDTEAFANEVLRRNPPTIIAPFVRIATRDVALEGGTVPEGADVRLLIGAANRDPAVFRDPDRLDPSRDTRASLVFAGGIHRCIGAGLARAEMEVALPRLLARFPSLRAGADPTWSPAVFHHMARTLPVKLGDD